MTLEVHETRPHLVVRVASELTIDDLSPHVQAFEEALARMPPRFVLLIDRIDLRSYDAHISGVVLYLAFQVFRANPAAVLIVTGGEILNVWLYNRLRRIDRLNVLHVFNTHEEAEAFLEAHRTDQDLML